MDKNNENVKLKKYIDDIAFYRDLITDLDDIEINNEDRLNSQKLLNSIEQRAFDLLFLENEIIKGNKNVTIAVIGNFNSGKSNFINSLLGHKVCPVKAHPTTSSITTFLYSDRKEIILNSEESISQERYDELVTHKSGNINKTDRYEFEYHYPFDGLRDIEILDTPGFQNDKNKLDEKITFDRAKYADIVFYISDIDKGAISGNEIKKIEELQKIQGKYEWYLVINKSDSKPPQQQVNLLNSYIEKNKNLFEKIFLYSSENILKTSIKSKQQYRGNLLWNSISDAINNDKDRESNISLTYKNGYAIIESTGNKPDDLITSIINREKIIDIFSVSNSTKRKHLRQSINNKKESYNELKKTDINKIKKSLQPKNLTNFSKITDDFSNKLNNEINDTISNIEEELKSIMDFTFQIEKVSNEEKPYILYPYYKINFNSINIDSLDKSFFSNIHSILKKFEKEVKEFGFELSDNTVKEYITPKENFVNIINTAFKKVYSSYFESNYFNNMKSADENKNEKIKIVINEEMKELISNIEEIKICLTSGIAELTGQFQQKEKHLEEKSNNVIKRIEGFLFN